jgi:hypothetical protein
MFSSHPVRSSPSTRPNPNRASWLQVIVNKMRRFVRDEQNELFPSLFGLLIFQLLLPLPIEGFFAVHLFHLVFFLHDPLRFFPFHKRRITIGFEAP